MFEQNNVSKRLDCRLLLLEVIIDKYMASFQCYYIPRFLSQCWMPWAVNRWFKVISNLISGNCNIVVINSVENALVDGKNLLQLVDSLNTATNKIWVVKMTATIKMNCEWNGYLGLNAALYCSVDCDFKKWFYSPSLVDWQIVYTSNTNC